MLALVAIHIAAILWYRYAKHNDLIGPMIHGDIRMPIVAQGPIESAQDTWKLWFKALALAAFIALGIWWLTTLAPAAESFY